jgi:hypothetical protein
MPNAADENALAHNMIEVHGIEATGIARANARADAVAGEIVAAKSWLRVLREIQRQLAEQAEVSEVLKEQRNQVKRERSRPVIDTLKKST